MALIEINTIETIEDMTDQEFQELFTKVSREYRRRLMGRPRI